MLHFLLTRLIGLGVTVLGVVALVFFALHAVPGDPLEVMLGDQVGFADRQQLAQTLGLDQPVHEQFRHYLAGLVQGDLGQSIHRQTAVSTLIAERLPRTIQLALTSMLLALLIALPLGIWAAQHPGQCQDKLALVLSLSGISIPNFVLGPILVLVFSLSLQWLPTGGFTAVNAWVLPSLALGTAMAAMLSRMLRASLLEVSNQTVCDQCQSSRAFGRSLLESTYFAECTATGDDCVWLATGHLARWSSDC